MKMRSQLPILTLGLAKFAWLSATAAALITGDLVAQDAAPVGPSTAIQRRAAPPARVTEFRAEPDSIQPGQSVTLFWAVENPQGTNIDQGIGIVTPRGSRRITPAATTTYTLTTKGFNGVVTKEVTVTVAGTTPVTGAALTDTSKKQLVRLANGKPDFSGVYGSAGVRGGTPPVLKLGSEKFKVVRGPDDVGLYADCMPPGVPQSFSAPYPFQIVQTPQLVVIFYEYPNVFRIIPADGRPHPADPDPTWMGESVAHWDEDTLVIDSVGFNEKTEVNGYRHTDKLHVVERLRRIENGDTRGSLLYDVTVEDPNVFASPWIMPARTFPLRPELEKIDEFVCENNRDYRPLFKK
jgi:hypothetical protein